MISRTLMALLFLFLTFSGFLNTSTVQAQDHDDIAKHRECTECGMDRKAYGFSRMLIVFEGGKEVGTCSIHCAVLVMNSHKGEAIKSLLVADRNSHDLIPAQEAIWVIGGKKRGVMTMKAKWAFSTKAAAQSFIDEYEGQIASWEEILSAARTESMSMKM